MTVRRPESIYRSIHTGQVSAGYRRAVAIAVKNSRRGGLLWLHLDWPSRKVDRGAGQGPVMENPGLFFRTKMFVFSCLSSEWGSAPNPGSFLARPRK